MLGVRQEQAGLADEEAPFQPRNTCLTTRIVPHMSTFVPMGLIEVINSIARPVECVPQSASITRKVLDYSSRCSFARHIRGDPAFPFCIACFQVQCRSCRVMHLLPHREACFAVAFHILLLRESRFKTDNSRFA